MSTPRIFTASICARATAARTSPTTIAALPSMTGLTTPNSRSHAELRQQRFVDAGAGADDLDRGLAGHRFERGLEAAHRAGVGQLDRDHDGDAERDAEHRRDRADLLLSRRRRMNWRKRLMVASSGPLAGAAFHANRAVLHPQRPRRRGRDVGGMRRQQHRDAQLPCSARRSAPARWRRSRNRGCRSARRRRAAPAGGRARARSRRAAFRRRRSAAGSAAADARCRRARPARGARVRLRRPFMPASRQGSAMLSPTRQRRQQVEELEDEADLLAPHARQLIVAHRRQVAIVEVDRAADRAIHRAAQVQQRRLAASRRPHQRDEVAALDRERHAGERADACIAVV